MSDKHTPGPWRVVRQNGSPTTGEWMIAGGKPGYIAEVRDCGSGDVGANASIMAASLDLLDALECLKRELILSDVDMGYIESHFSPWIKKAEKAISKARNSF